MLEMGQRGFLARDAYPVNKLCPVRTYDHEHCAVLCRACNMLRMLHTYHSCFISEGIAGASQIFLQDAHVLPKIFSYE
jgi:hypothetical protein